MRMRPLISDNRRRAERPISNKKIWNWKEKLMESSTLPLFNVIISTLCFFWGGGGKYSFVAEVICRVKF